ncbi:hypothetical protein GF327_00005 [Candidatus Woesearchaeota archaeon]|nr:hypothetical protein [Candidatus Woesearchaeota archaeon]
MIEIIVSYLPVILHIILVLNLSVLFLLSVYYRKYFFDYVKLFDKKTVFFLILIFFIGFFLRMCVFPHQHQVFFDEDTYLDMAKHMAAKAKAGICNSISINGKCQSELTLTHYPKGWPFIISIFFRMFGISHNLGFIINSVLGSLSVFLVFFLADLVFNDKKAGLWASMFLAVSPVHVIFSKSSSAEISSVFFILLTLCLYFLFLKEKKTGYLLMFFASLVFCIQTRFENFVLLLLIFRVFLKIRKNLAKKHILILLSCLIAVIPLLFLIFFFIERYINSKIWIFSFNVLISNIFPLISAFFNFRFITVFFVVFFFFGIIKSIKINNKAHYVLLIFAFVVTILYASFENLFFGSVENYRRMIPNFSLLVCFSGYGIKNFLKLFMNKKKRLILTLLIVVFIFFNSFFILSSYYSSPRREVALEHDLIRKYSKNISNDCVVLTYYPYVFDFLNINSVFMDEYFSNNEIRTLVDNNFNCTILLYDNILDIKSIGYCEINKAILLKDSSYCSKIEESFYRKYCDTIFSENTESCEIYESRVRKDECYFGKFRLKHDKKLCLLINNDVRKNMCLNDLKPDNKIRSTKSKLRDDTYLVYALSYNNITFCENINNLDTNFFCYILLQNNSCNVLDLFNITRLEVFGPENKYGFYFVNTETKK